MFINNTRVGDRIRLDYSAEQIAETADFLKRQGTFTFSPLPNGLFPAASLGESKSYTGYSYVWVRDNIHIAYAHYSVGHVSTATKTLGTLMQYFIKHRSRFIDIIAGRTSPDDVMKRPHIRFNGSTLEEVNERWAHAQNDALGYFLWLYSKLVNEKKLSPAADELDTLLLFPLYFEAIRYWEDEDSGHWEETRKVSASSIGTVIAGLREFGRLVSNVPVVCKSNQKVITLEFIESLQRYGLGALESMLPAECVQADASKQRLYDSALLFLIYPLQVVETRVAEIILGNVIGHLQGEFGIRRYPGDSYWAPDYKKRMKPNERTMDFSDDIVRRDQFLPSLGQEAQWCIFDPIVSCIYGTKFKEKRTEEVLSKQTEYLNRSLGQITSEGLPDIPAFRCPELYYLEDGRYVPNDHVPLLWTQANLMLSLSVMQESCMLGRPLRALGS